MAQGIEPDQCFYIKNHLLMRGKTRVDLTVDPLPDLAIEIDLTSKTQIWKTLNYGQGYMDL